ncbi:MAG: T9SS type A sorting domain-containing protein [Bacteroidia bacterium]|nr:T9SS type A sorting domain-containing protein [Bacteroidia bacterium]
MKKIYSSLFTLMCFLGYSQIPTSGMVERFMFNNNLNGQMGNVFTAQKPQYAPDRFGNPNSAYRIAIDSNCIVNGIVNGIPQGNTDRSVCLWIRNLPPYNNIKSYFNYSIQTDCFAFTQESAPNNKVVTNYTNNITSSASGDSAWHCLVATHASGTTTFYIDGVLIGSKIITYYNNTNLVRMGRSPAITPNGALYPGFLADELIIYNRALTPTEVSQICAIGMGVQETTDISLSTTIYPVPASKELLIKSGEGFDFYTITDITGKTITTGNLSENKIRFNLTSGIYFLQLQSKDNKTATKKFIVE